MLSRFLFWAYQGRDPLIKFIKFYGDAFIKFYGDAYIL